jgi:hypothetical protein
MNSLISVTSAFVFLYLPLLCKSKANYPKMVQKNDLIQKNDTISSLNCPAASGSLPAGPVTEIFPVFLMINNMNDCLSMFLKNMGKGNSINKLFITTKTKIFTL